MKQRLASVLTLGTSLAFSLLSCQFADAQDPAPEPTSSASDSPATPVPGASQAGGTGTTGTAGTVDAPPASLSDSRVCPLFPFMYHNGFTSYYALYWSSLSKCTTPTAYTGANGLSGNCATGAGCPDVLAALAAVTADAPDPSATASIATALKINHIPEEIRKNGYTTAGEITLAPGVQALHQEVKAIEFALDPNGDRVVKAKVKFGYLTKNQITLAAGIGTGLQANDLIAPDRSAGKNEVITLERDRHAVRVLVRMSQSEWRELMIILPNGMAN